MPFPNAISYQLFLAVMVADASPKTRRGAGTKEGGGPIDPPPSLS